MTTSWVMLCHCDFSGSTKDMNFKLCMQLACGGRSMPIYINFLYFSEKINFCIYLNSHVPPAYNLQLRWGPQWWVVTLFTVKCTDTFRSWNVSMRACCVGSINMCIPIRAAFWHQCFVITTSTWTASTRRSTLHWTSCQEVHKQWDQPPIHLW